MLIEKADALIEGFRPMVAERLGIGPEVCTSRNPRLVYGRVTGWGRDGPLAQAPGHDLNYIALAGALHHIGHQHQGPVPPLNLIGDFAGGGMLLAFGMACALFETRRSGLGQVVDAAMVDGAAALMTFMYGLDSEGLWDQDRGTNVFDGGAPFYTVYETLDDKYLCVAAVEPQFYAELLRLIGLNDPDLPHQMDREQWPTMKGLLASIFRTKTRQEWCAVLEGTDACVTPVLSMRDAPNHPQNRHRRTFVKLDGSVQPAPAPRFSRTPGSIGSPPARPGEHTDEALADWGLSSDLIATLRQDGAIS